MKRYHAAPMTVRTDRSGKRFTEVDLPSGRVRLTYIRRGWSGSPSVRIQIREPNGHLRLGPEIPVAQLGDFLKALLDGALELVAGRGRT